MKQLQITAVIMTSNGYGMCDISAGSARGLINCRESLDGEFLILDPSSFQQDASGPTWTDIDSCVWNGPENLLDKKPLAAVRQYDTEKLANFFKQALGIRDANWTDYVEMIVKIQDSQIDRSQMQEKLRRLYDLLSDVRGSRVRASIR